MGKKAKGGGLLAGGKGELKALEAFGIDVMRGVLDGDEGRSCGSASPVMGGEMLEEEAAALFMEEVLAGKVKELGGFHEGPGMDGALHGGLGGNVEEWPELRSGGAGDGRSPAVPKGDGRLLRSGRTWGAPAIGAGCMDVTVNSAMQRGNEGFSSPAPAVAGGLAGGAGVVAGGASLLGAAPAAGVLGGGPAGGGMAGICDLKDKGYWEEVAGGCEVNSGDLCGGKMWVVDGKLWASWRWVEGGGDGRKVKVVGGSGGRGEGSVGGMMVAGVGGAVASGGAAGVARVAGEIGEAGRQGEGAGGGAKFAEGGGVVGGCGDGLAAGLLVAGVGGMAGAVVAAGVGVVVDVEGVAGKVQVAGRQEEAGGGGGGSLSVEGG